MNLPIIYVYIFSGSVCFSMAINLLFCKSLTNKDNISFKQIKNKIAFSGLVDVLIDILIIPLVNNNDIASSRYFIIPSAYCIQMLLMTVAIVELIHTSSKKRKIFKRIYIPYWGINVIYILGFFFYSNTFSAQAFKDYNSTILGSSSCHILYLFTIVSFLYCLYTLISNTISYQKKLNNYHSGNEVIKGSQIRYIACCFICYFIVTPFTYLIKNEIIDAYIIILNTLVYMYFIIFISNIEKIFNQTKALDEFNPDENIASFKSIIPSMSEDLINNELSQKFTNTEEASEGYIISTIRKWEQREDKPYLKEGILISDVSQHIGLNVNQLSFILNHSLNTSFSNWINTLRIRESKRLIMENQKISLTAVAEASGFCDIYSFSKIFKKITGETPSSYKKKINK